MKFVFSFFILVFSVQLFAQNIVSNGDFEDLKRDTVYPTGRSVWFNDTVYYIDSFTTYWKSLFKAPLYHNNSVPTYFNGIYADSLPKPFKNYGCVWISPNYRTYDTINNSIVLFLDTIGGYPEFYAYSGFWWNYNSGIYQKLKYPLERDTTYIISYRLKNGSDIKSFSQMYSNFINIFGVLFSTKNISNVKQYKINYYNKNLQDTVLDTTYKWRLIKNEFIADSAYQYINFAQFKDLRDVKYIVKTFDKYNIGGRFNHVYFALFLDDIRLLPKWQYLEVTPDIDACAYDSVELNVYSGAGPYTWVQADSPHIILSTSSSLKIKLGDTNIKYQVMSPYDTALIPIYITKNTLLYDTLYYHSCENKPLSLSVPDIHRWYDNTQDTQKTIINTQSLWYETKHICTIKRTTVQATISNNSIDTTNKTNCDSLTWQNQVYHNSGFYTKNYQSILGCDSILNLNLTLFPSYRDTFRIQTCQSYLWNTNTYTQSGFYSHTYKIINQCDSLVTLDLRIGLNNKIKLENGTNYTALQDSVSYQWYRCNPWQRIANETKQKFTTYTRGSYAVVINDNKGCIDTSDCLALYSSSVVIPANAGILVYPNPFTDNITIELDRSYKEVSIKLYDVSGRLVFSNNPRNIIHYSLITNHYTKGVYYLQVETEKESRFFNILKD